MARLRNCRLFLLLVSLLFAVGHSHQVFGQFQAHHHDIEVVADHQHQDSDDHRHDGDEEKDAEHMAEHAAFAAIVPALFIPARMKLHPLAPVNLVAARTLEPRPAGIDHPPQLA